MFFAGILVVITFFDPCLNVLSSINESTGWAIAAIVAASFLPLGWLFYNSFRFWFDLIGGDYEGTKAMELIRNKVWRKRYNENCIEIDITRVMNNRVDNEKTKKVFWVNSGGYNTLFDPYKILKYFRGSYHWRKQNEEAQKPRTRFDNLEKWAFTEHILHLTFFRNHGLADYTRGFAGAVNGLVAGSYAFLFGIFLSLSYNANLWAAILLFLLFLIFDLYIIISILIYIKSDPWKEMKRMVYAGMMLLIVLLIIVGPLIFNFLSVKYLNFLVIYSGLFLLVITNICSGFICKNENDARLLLSALITSGEDCEGEVKK